VSIGWYTNEIVNIARELGIPVIAPWRDMPDAMKCKEKNWMPYIIHDLLEIDPGGDGKTSTSLAKNTILVGHSTGADAVLRTLEQVSVLGAVIIAAGPTPLKEGETVEPDQGWYNRPWDWKKIKENASWIAHYHSEDDDTVPVAEGRRIATVHHHPCIRSCG
jgi:pimeloyl-ACP methyl ester carboxylesterase